MGQNIGNKSVCKFQSVIPVYQKIQRRCVIDRKSGDFRNAMLGRAEKGIIITTGHFTNEAIKEANRDGAPKVELVDGEKLIKMFEKVELGVKAKTVYEVDINFFEPFFNWIVS